MRESGILFPIFSIPSKYGIGCFSGEAYEFVDFLEHSGQGFWQILPVGPTGFGNSPYQPFSAFAGNPYFICPETLIEEGLLTREEVDAVSFGDNVEKVDYGAIYEGRHGILTRAYERFLEKIKATTKDDDEPAGDGTPAAVNVPAQVAENSEESENKDKKKTLSEEYDEFLKKESYWIEDYALFMALKQEANGASWLEWKDDIRTREKDAVEKAKKKLADEMGVYLFEQFEFDRQWHALRRYANRKNVKIIGDLPFYVSLDSADAWSHPEVFLMDKDLKPTVVAGCPPDAFSPTGQLWGNPIYDWKKDAKDDYDWWVRRMKRNYEFYDVIRIDHFHGFCDYYAIPYGDETAEKGKLEKGPGIAFFNTLKKKIGELRIIAEDLGNNTPENAKLLEDTGFPGMKVLQYGFTSWDSIYVNHRHTANSVVYTGTHDNTPTRAWAEEINDGERDFTRRYINSMNTDLGGLTWDIIREAYRSVADLCIVPLQDYLCFGREARINTPGAPEGNWQWRLRPNYLSAELEKSIRGLAEVYSRIPKAPQD